MLVDEHCSLSGGCYEKEQGLEGVYVIPVRVQARYSICQVGTLLGGNDHNGDVPNGDVQKLRGEKLIGQGQRLLTGGNRAALIKSLKGVLEIEASVRDVAQATEQATARAAAVENRRARGMRRNRGKNNQRGQSH